MKISDMKVSQIQEQGQSMATYAQIHLGYTTSSFCGFDYDTNGEARITLRATDAFQNDLPSADRAHCPYIFIRGETLDELWSSLRERPTLEMRELQVTIKITEKLRGKVDLMKSTLLRKEFERMFIHIDSAKDALLPAPGGAGTSTD